MKAKCTLIGYDNGCYWAEFEKEGGGRMGVLTQAIHHYIVGETYIFK